VIIQPFEWYVVLVSIRQEKQQTHIQTNGRQRGFELFAIQGAGVLYGRTLRIGIVELVATETSPLIQTSVSGSSKLGVDGFKALGRRLKLST
jgi:hypothetical protein